MASIMWWWINGGVTELLLPDGGGWGVCSKSKSCVWKESVCLCSLNPDLVIVYRQDSWVSLSQRDTHKNSHSNCLLLWVILEAQMKSSANVQCCAKVYRKVVDLFWNKTTSQNIQAEALKNHLQPQEEQWALKLMLWTHRVLISTTWSQSGLQEETEGRYSFLSLLQHPSFYFLPLIQGRVSVAAG